MNKIAEQAQGQSIPGFAGQLATEIITDAPKDWVRDGASAVNLGVAGDRQGAIGKTLSSAGNGLLTASMFVPGAALGGKAIRKGSRALGIASKFLGKPSIASKITRFGTLAGKYLGAPEAIIKKSPIFKPFSKIIGSNKILKTSPKIQGATIGQNTKRVLGNTGKTIFNITTPLAASLGTMGAGEYTYATSPSGKMEAMQNSSIFNDIVGKDLANEISSLSAKEKLKVYDYLKTTDVPQRTLGDWAVEN
jgi:hypothetical protein